MNSDQLANALIQSAEDAPQDIVDLRNEIKAAIEKYTIPRKALIDELKENKDKFDETLAKIVDKKTDTGIVDAIDFPFIHKVVKLITEVTGIYAKLTIEII